MDRALTFGIGLPSHAGAMQPPSAPPNEEAPGVAAFASDSEGLKWSGRQDLNLRPRWSRTHPLAPHLFLGASPDQVDFEASR